MDLQKKQKIKLNSSSLIFFFLVLFLMCSQTVLAKGLTIPAKGWGICFGNSPIFTGFRFNFMDNNIKRINGINFTMGKPRNTQATGTVNGLSLGLIPYAANLNGIQIGLINIVRDNPRRRKVLPIINFNF